MIKMVVFIDWLMYNYKDLVVGVYDDCSVIIFFVMPIETC
jgi:hypothetical protein